MDDQVRPLAHITKNTMTFDWEQSFLWWTDEENVILRSGSFIMNKK